MYVSVQWLWKKMQIKRRLKGICSSGKRATKGVAGWDW